MTIQPLQLTRRGFLRAAFALTTPVALAWVAGRGVIGRNMAHAGSLRLTPECGDSDSTLEQTEGPYFTASSPEKTSLLESGLGGTRLALSGVVLGASCQPIVGALIDFWQADDRGQYDNIGYQLRGHQFSDSSGSYSLTTIVPGLYPGRTRHIHVKVQAPGGPVLTTQLYFPGEPGNRRDFSYRPELEMSVSDDEAGERIAHFDFVIATA